MSLKALRSSSPLWYLRHRARGADPTTSAMPRRRRTTCMRYHCNPCLTRHQESTARPAPQNAPNDPRAGGPRIFPLGPLPLLSCNCAAAPTPAVLGAIALQLYYGPLGSFTWPPVAFADRSSLLLKRFCCAGLDIVVLSGALGATARGVEP